MEHLLTYIIINCVELQFRGAMLLRAQSWRLVSSLAPFVCFLGSYACASFIREELRFTSSYYLFDS